MCINVRAVTPELIESEERIESDEDSSDEEYEWQDLIELPSDELDAQELNSVARQIVDRVDDIIDDATRIILMVYNALMRSRDANGKDLVLDETQRQN